MCQSVYCSEEEEEERERENGSIAKCDRKCNVALKRRKLYYCTVFVCYFQLCSAFYANYSWKFHTQNYHFRLRLQCHLFPSPPIYLYVWRELCVSLNEKFIALPFAWLRIGLVSYRCNQWKKSKCKKNIISHLLTCGMMIAGASVGAFAQFHKTFLYYLT